MEILQFLILPFLAGLVLTGIHAYLGVHVVERGVIFVDLSLAQIAALGTTVALLAGYDVHSGISYFWSLGFTIVGAAIFALTKVKHETRIPQEAIIGIVYAVSAAAAILVMSKAPQETEHLKAPKYSPLLISRAAALGDLERWEEAKTTLDRAIALKSSPEAAEVADRIKANRPDLYETAKT